MRSMTGYGKGVAAADGVTLTVEIKSVNNKFLEINNRIPKGYVFLDAAVRKAIGDRLRRGSVDVYYDIATVQSDVEPTVDEALAAKYAAAARALVASPAVNAAEPHVAFALTARELMLLPGVLTERRAEADDAQKEALVSAAVAQALDALVAAREAEGKALAEDLSATLGRMRTALDAIAARAPGILSDYNTRLHERVRALLDEVPLDEARLATELAVYADRVDTNEEIKRLYAHFDAFGACIGADGEIGRRMDFLTQEIGRETNTLGVKCSDLETTRLVLSIKNETERLKEQSRNVE